MRFRAEAGSAISPAFFKSSSLSPIVPRAALSTFVSPSHRATSKPERAKTMAQARPISPAPTMPILLMGASEERLGVGIDGERLAGDVVAGRARQEDRHAGDVVRGHHAA